MWNETVLGTELYDHGPGDIVSNTAEASNVVARKENQEVVRRLSALLRNGWRGDDKKLMAEEINRVL